MSFFAKALESKPRFSLSASTGVLVRYSGHDYVPWEEPCTILHVNLSGVAIAVPEHLLPVLGEWITLDVPSEVVKESLRFYGKVVHLQDLSDNYKGVVIQFLSHQLGEKFEISRAFSNLQSARKSVQQEPQLVDLGKLSKRKTVLVALALFWLMAFAVILAG